MDLDQLEIFVLDEADRMLDMGFIHDVKKILQWLPRKKQTMLFSATMPPEIADLVNSLLHDPVRVAVDPISSPVEAIRQSVYSGGQGEQDQAAGLPHGGAAGEERPGVHPHQARGQQGGPGPGQGGHLRRRHPRQQEPDRPAAGPGRLQGGAGSSCLVATDIAARGLDIEELSHVFNYNLPEVPETYVHRIGRTGRAGRGGEAISFCDFGEKPLLRDIEKLIGRKVPLVEDHPYPMQVFEAPKRDKNGRIINEEDAEARAAARELRRQREENARQAAQHAQEKEAARRLALEEAAQLTEKKSRRRRKKAAAPQEAAPAPPPSSGRRRSPRSPTSPAPPPAGASGRAA